MFPKTFPLPLIWEAEPRDSLAHAETWWSCLGSRRRGLWFVFLITFLFFFFKKKTSKRNKSIQKRSPWQASGANMVWRVRDDYFHTNQVGLSSVPVSPIRLQLIIGVALLVLQLSFHFRMRTPKREKLVVWSNSAEASAISASSALCAWLFGCYFCRRRRVMSWRNWRPCSQLEATWSDRSRSVGALGLRERESWDSSRNVKDASRAGSASRLKKYRSRAVLRFACGSNLFLAEKKVKNFSKPRLVFCAVNEVVFGQCSCSLIFFPFFFVLIVFFLFRCFSCLFRSRFAVLRFGSVRSSSCLVTRVKRFAFIKTFLLFFFLLVFRFSRSCRSWADFFLSLGPSNLRLG